MTSPDPTLLLTRPEAQSKAFLKTCEGLLGREITSVISPLMRIVLADTPPNLDLYATIIFTSGNGVRSVLETNDLNGRTVATVGEKTAVLARASGAEAEALGEDVEGFLTEASRVKGPVLFCRGKHTRGDLAGRLRESGKRVDEAIVYDQEARPLSFAANDLLSGGNPVVAPIFSPRTASLLNDQDEIAAPLTIIAMSDAVAKAWRGGGRVLLAETPTSRAMARLTVAQF